MIDLVWEPGEKLVVFKDVEAIVSRVIWDGEQWSYHIIWMNSGELQGNEFSFKELMAIRVEEKK